MDSRHPEPLFHTALNIPDNVNTHEERLCQGTRAGIESNQKTTSFGFWTLPAVGLIPNRNKKSIKKFNKVTN